MLAKTANWDSITTKILRRKSGTNTLAILGRAETWGCSPLFSRKFPLPDASIVFSNTSKPSPEETRRKAEPPQGGLPSRGRVRLGNRAGCQPAKTSVRPCPPSRKPGFPAFLELVTDAEGALEVVFLRFVAHALPQILIQIEADVAEFHEQGEVLVQLVFRVEVHFHGLVARG